MKINASYIIAGLLIVLIGLWFLLNKGGRSSDANQTNPAVQAEKVDKPPQVIVQRITAQNHPNVLELYGRSEPNRNVAIKAETAGIVVATPVREGKIISKGTILCRQDVDARQAIVDQARANLKSRDYDFKATQTLVNKGFRSATQLESQKALVDGAKAALVQAEIELDNVNMRAPFKGLITKQIAETGDYLAPGQACAQLLEMNPLIVTGDLTESQVGHVKLGLLTQIDLATGQSVMGKVRFIDPSANAATRTFRFEIEVPNPDYALKGGVTASVKLLIGEVMAHRIPGRILSLGASGDVGVRYLTDDNRVHFKTVQTIDEDGDGVWVTGLPETTRIIVQGQDYVSEGVKVDPVTKAVGKPL